MCYVLKTDLLHVWAHCLSKTFCLIDYQPTGWLYKLYRPEQWTKFQKLVRLKLASLFKYIHWRCPEWFWSSFWFVFLWGTLIRRNENISGLEHMSSILFGNIRRQNFSTYSELFGRILAVKMWQSTSPYSQNPPKRFRMFRKVSAAKVSGKQA